MAKTPEGEVKKIIKKGLEACAILPFEKALAYIKTNNSPIAGYYMMPGSTGMGEAGIGDFLICLRGNYVEIEVKKEKGEPTGIQKAHASVVAASGGQTFLVRGEKDAHVFVKFITKEVLGLIEIENMADKAHDALSSAAAQIEKDKSGGVTH